MSHLPTNFCFLLNGHPLDPSVEANIKAYDVAVSHDSQFILLIDNLQCNIGPDSGTLMARRPSGLLAVILCVCLFGVCIGYFFYPSCHGVHSSAGYEKVPLVGCSEKRKQFIPCIHPPCLRNLLQIQVMKSRNCNQPKIEVKKKSQECLNCSSVPP